MKNQKELSRKSFLVRSARWCLGGILAATGVFEIWKRQKLESEGGCDTYNTCRRCIEYQGCGKPEKV